MKVKVPKNIIKDCENFANKVITTNVDKYRTRNQFQADMIKKQIIQGKIAEFGVYYFFDGRCSEPDLEVYPKQNKSFDADLHLSNINLHIKSQSKESEARYSKSWVFQAEDPLFKNASDNDLCVFCTVDNDEVEISLVKKFKNVKFGEPKLAKFRDIKRMVYYEENSCNR